jgi:Zn-dependent M28 family amino/carboxypeptidase
VLEIAEAYALAAREGKRPGRSILFVVFNAEEQGLLGSWAFVERPPVPLDRIVAVLNMDMIGRGSTRKLPRPEPIELPSLRRREAASSRTQTEGKPRLRASKAIRPNRKPTASRFVPLGLLSLDAPDSADYSGPRHRRA